MNSGIILNYQRPGNIGSSEFHPTGLTRLIPFAMDTIAIKKMEVL
jgi:hypothetical protein